MPGRNAFATPTNVYPRNGAPVVFNGDNQFFCSFTNNSDSIAFVQYDFYDALTNEWLLSKYCRWVNEDTFSITSNRGDRYSMDFDRHDETTGMDFINGYHYKYRITLYGCCPHEVAGGYTLQPNAIVTFASGEVYEAISQTQFYIASAINKIRIPVYWEYPYVTEYPDVRDNMIACCYVRIGHEKRMIIAYDRQSGFIKVETPFSFVPSEGMQYYLDCNYISSSGSETEGSYDFYVRQNINATVSATPVPWGLQCASTYSHPDMVGLENYQFKLYAMFGDACINGVVGNSITGADGNTLTDNQHIPIGAGITNNLIHKRLIIGTSDDVDQRVTSGEWGEITYYDSSNGIATIDRALSTYPTAGLPYTIDLSDRELIGDSGNCYSYHLHYNFPVYVLGDLEKENGNMTFRLESVLTTYEKQVLDKSLDVSVAMPQLDYDYGQVNNTYTIEQNARHTVYLEFDPRVASDTRYFAIYRRETGKTMWRYLGFIHGDNTYIDYLVANNKSYDYLISKSVVEGVEYNPANEFKPYAFKNAANTSWDGWTITAIYPCESDYIDDTIDNIRQKKKNTSPLESFVCNRTPYKVGDTWTFVASIDSGEIVNNVNRNLHVGTSRYPTVTRGSNNYQSGSFSADLLTIECPTEEIYDNIQKVNKWIKFINDDCLFILKSDKGDVWIVSISENTSRSYDESVNPILTKVSYSWVEVDDPDNIQIVETANE